MASEWDGIERRVEFSPLLTLTADIVAAHVANNTVAVNDLPQLIANVHGALGALNNPAAPEAEKLEPKVSIRASVKPERITCLECGMKLKMLKRHLRVEHGQTPAEYRERWNLGKDYPFVAPDYAAQRRTLAKSIGLGTNKAAHAKRSKTLSLKKAG
ncbi:MAG: transcriptional regulator [Verrucomicrobia bacterium]|nr:MAG: transcriptional regulator [Verrucomicrobiota bacterium]